MGDRTSMRWFRLASVLITTIALTATTISCNKGNDTKTATPSENESRQTLESPQQLTSYRYNIASEIWGDARSGLTGIIPGLALDLNISLEVYGAVIAPDREQSLLTVNFGLLTLERETIRIRNQVWRREFGRKWKLEGGPIPNPLDFGFNLSPTDFFGNSVTKNSLDVLSSTLSKIEGTPDSVNQIETVRYTLTEEQFTDAFPDANPIPDNGRSNAIAAKTSATIWVARDSGVPVRLTVETTLIPDESGNGNGGAYLQLNIIDLNSDGIEIKAPK